MDDLQTTTADSGDAQATIDTTVNDGSNGAQFFTAEYATLEDAAAALPGLQLDDFMNFGSDGSVDVIALLLPAVQCGCRDTSAPDGDVELLKMVWTPEDTEGFLTAYREGTYEDFGHDLVLAAPDANDQAFDEVVVFERASDPWVVFSPSADIF